MAGEDVSLRRLLFSYALLQTGTVIAAWNTYSGTTGATRTVTVVAFLATECLFVVGLWRGLRRRQDLLHGDQSDPPPL